MRKFDTDMSCCFSEKQYNNIMYGKQSPYITCDIDYKKDIQILCIKGVMEIYTAREAGGYVAYKFAVKTACLGLYPLLELCLDISKANNKTHEISQFIIQKLNQESDALNELIGSIDDDEAEVLSFLQKGMGKNKEEEIRLETMLRELDLFHHTFYLNDKVPLEMNPLIERFVNHLYRELEIDAEPTVVANKKQQRGKEKEGTQKGIFVRDGVVVLKDLYFDELLQTSFLSETLEDRIPHISRALFLDHCCFDIPHLCMGPLSDHSVMFKNCHFKQGFIWMGQSNGTELIFDNCVMSDEFEITLPRILSLYLNDCIFEKDSTVKLDWFGPDDTLPRAFITDCVFHGGFELSKWRKLRLDMSNVTFYKPFTIKDTTLHKDSRISNLCFPSNATDEMEESKKQLADALVAADLKEMAEGLNLLTKGKTKKPDFDYAAYQAAYNSGWLKPEYAAYFLGKSINYLAKKRMDDKKKLSRDSLPYKMDGRDIQYPVEALMSFKAKDWEKLKELRKKYEYPAKK